MENIYSVYKYKNFFLNYVLKYRPGRPLVIIFSAVDSFPGRNLTSYFGYQNSLDASVLHIVDNFGAHGCYYMQIHGESDVSEGFASLIQYVMSVCGVPLKDTWFCGTSKGASAAMYYSLRFGGGNCILGEPQIMVGDFLFKDGEPQNEAARAIAYTMTGRVSASDQIELNTIIPNIARQNLKKWADGGGQAVLYVSELTGYLWRHVRHLQEILKEYPEAEKNFHICVKNFNSHNDVSGVFKMALENEFGLVDFGLKNMKMQEMVSGKYFLGITRFSLFLPNNPAFYLTQKSEDEYLKDLYDPERMRTRLDIFVNRALPIYERMSQGFFYRHVVQCSTEMPSEYMLELEAAASRYPFLFLQKMDRNGKGDSLDILFADQPDGSIGIFRVDDDDILTLNYMGQLSKYVDTAYHGMVVSFGRGFAAQYRDGHYSEFRNLQERFSSVGQCYIVPWSMAEGKISFPKVVSHNRVDESYPTICDSRFPAFLYTYHDAQDTAALRGVSASSIHPNLLQLSRPASFNELKALLPVLNEEIEIERSKGEVIFSAETELYIDSSPLSLEVEIEAGYNYDVEYRLVIGHGVSIGKGVVFSVMSSTDIPISGLTLSPARDIGYFRYMSSQNADALLSFSFSVPDGASVKRVVLMPWESKKYGAMFSNLRIIKR